MSSSEVQESAPAMHYLNQIGQRIAAVREDLGRLSALGEAMARPLLAGGGLFTPRIGTYWPSEFGGRAGGLMGLKPADYLAESDNDVAFTTLPDARRWKPANDAEFARLLAGPAKIFIIGREQDLNGAAPASRFAGFTGGVGAEEGRYGQEANRPLAPLRPFEQFVRGWVAAGEMIGAMTRGGRMPIIWMSVWLEGAFVRNATFMKHHNLREPWYAPLFHDEIYVPPLEPGYVVRTFLAELEKLHAMLIAQAPQLATAGRWMADAMRAGKRVSTVAVGHSYPAVLEIKELKDYPLEWLPSISDLRHAHPRELGPGDVALHLGYSPVDVADVHKILDRGVRFIYSSPYGRPRPDSLRELKDHKNLLWLDLPWRPADATVDVPGYSVRICPMSSSAHTMAYFAMISEMAEVMGWR